jgi:hypothetical protein
MAAFEEWESFYVIVGAAAGALIGLQFVVMTLIAEFPTKGMAQAAAAFASPTIVHFSFVLFLSAALRMPWHSATAFAVVWGATGVAGTAYLTMVVRRMRAQVAYRPDFEDWLYHVLLPFAGYLALLASAFFAAAHGEQSQFVVAGAVLVVLFAAIHNAWDAIAYHVLVVRQRKEHGEPGT